VEAAAPETAPSVEAAASETALSVVTAASVAVAVSVTAESSAERVAFRSFVVSVALGMSAAMEANGSVTLGSTAEAVLDGSVTVELSLPSLNALTSVPLVESGTQEQVETSAVVPNGHVPSTKILS
jgi:hypothetical protein